MPEFGQALQRECIRDWKPYYLNYNRLKGWIKEATQKNSDEAFKVFFEELQTNLKRVDAFYLAQEHEATEMVKKLNEMESLDEKDAYAKRIEDAIERLRCFAEMNSDGFRKITKKFDKRVASEDNPYARDASEDNDKGGLQKRMIEVVSTYPFADAQDRLLKLESAIQIHEAEAGKPDISLPMFEPKSRRSLENPFLMEKEKGAPPSKLQYRLNKLLTWVQRFLWTSWDLLIVSAIILTVARLELVARLTQEGYLVLWVTAVVLKFLPTQSPDVVLMAATLFLTVAGVLKESEAWAAFSNNVVLTVAGLGVIASVVGETGIIDLVFNFVLGRPKSLQMAMLRLFVPAVFLNLCISNTCVMSCLLPVIDKWSKEIGFHKAYFLMPLSYVLLISGTFAIFSTSTNLVAQGLLMTHHQKLFDNFDLAIPATVSSLVAGAYLVLFSPILLSRFKKTPGQDNSPNTLDIKKRTQNRYDLRVQIVGRALDGQTVGESIIMEKIQAGDVGSAERYGSDLGAINEDFKLQIDDILTIHTSVEGVTNLFYSEGLLVLAMDLSEDYGTLDPQTRHLVEAVLDKESPLVGHRVGNASVHRPEYSCPIVAYRAFNQRQGTDDSPRTLVLTPEIRLAPGDHIIFSATPTFYSTWHDSSDFVVLRRIDAKLIASESNRQNKSPKHPKSLKSFVGMIAGRGSTESGDEQSEKAVVSGLCLLGMILVVVTSTLKLLEAVVVTIAALAITGCTTMDSVVRAVKLRTSLAIVGAFGLGKAIGKEGVAGLLADILIFVLRPFGPYGLLIAVFAATVALGVVFHGTAVVVLMYPICAEVAEQMDLPIHQIVSVLCIAVACQMLSPISYQTNLMAYSTGGYQFADFTKVGSGLVVCIAAAGIPVCVRCFPALPPEVIAPA